MRKFSVILFILFFVFKAQSQSCNLADSYFDIKSVDYTDVICFAKNSEKPHTIFFTFARWCGPCLYHLPSALSIEKHFIADVYVLLVDPENSQMVKAAIDYVREDFPEAKILVIKDKPGTRIKQKYKEFLNTASPDKIYDMSKYIVLNKNGETELVTCYKDNAKDADRKDDRQMVRRIVLPLLTKKD